MLTELNDLPIRTVNGATVYMKDVAHVRDGFAVQTNIVRDERNPRGAAHRDCATAQASTLDIVNKVKAALPKILAGLPPELKVRQLFDQSIFVRASINGVVREASHRRRADRPDDPAVSRKLAQHRDRLHLDPAFDSDFADYSRACWARPST